MISIAGCAGALWLNEKDMPPQTGHPFRAHLDSASESATRDELGWAAATALSHARGEKLPGAEPCEVGERLVTGRLATFEAAAEALAALAPLDPSLELTESRLFNADGSAYETQPRKYGRATDQWRLDGRLGIEGEALSFHFTWDTQAHVLTLTQVTRGAPAAPSPTPR